MTSDVSTPIPDLTAYDLYPSRPDRRTARRRGPAAALAVLLLGAVGGGLVSVRPVAGLAFAGVLVALAHWRPSDLATRVLVVGLPAYFFSAFAPTWIAMSIQGVLVVTAGVMAARAAPGRRVAIPVLSGLIVGWWLVLLAVPNVPSLSTGLLGVRKSTFALVGLVLGWSCPAPSRQRIERLVVATLGASLAISCVMHTYAPALENRVVRSAGKATGEFEGRARLQGMFAGPFHVSMAAAFLCIWALFHLRRRPVVGTLAGVVGVIALSGANVRTGYVAIVLGCLCAALFASRTGTRARRLCGLAALALTAVLALSSKLVEPTGAAVTVLTASSDTRFRGRFPQMTEALHLIRRSSLVGWGPGAAGDAMGRLFGSGRVHVTAHNVVLKLGVEGGLIGLLLVALLLVELGRRVNPHAPVGASAVMAAAVMVAFGLTGSMIEALPVTFALFMLVGLAVE